MRNKIHEIGKLKLLEDGGLACLVTTDQRPSIDGSALLAAFCSASPASELTFGDVVAHFHHGIGRYTGRKNVPQTAGAEHEFTILEFAFGAHLYVPDDRLHFIQKLSSPHFQLSDLNAKRARWSQAYLLEALPNAYAWPTVGTFPEYPKVPSGRQKGPTSPALSQLVSEWRRACTGFLAALHANETYREAARGYLNRQKGEPQPLLEWWAYRDAVFQVTAGPDAVRDRNELALLIKQSALRRERAMEKVRREVEALENGEPMQNRESIPEEVRLFVWRRDKGRCVRCGSRERLEFDHIIPVALGGGNTARNIELLCERHNRSKSDAI